jgi:hypothetical protein
MSMEFSATGFDVFAGSGPYCWKRCAAALWSGHGEWGTAKPPPVDLDAQQGAALIAKIEARDSPYPACRPGMSLAEQRHDAELARTGATLNQPGYWRPG